METPPINQSSTTQPLESLNGGKGAEKEQFLNLLVAQLKYQDPMNPMKGTEFTAQLAQFSSLEQLFEVNTNLDNVQSAQEAFNQLQMTQYIGKNVMTRGDSLTLSQGDISSAQFNVTQKADSGSLSIYEPFGSLVRILDIGQTNAGTYPVTWDGRDINGNLMADGEYTFQANFYDVDGDYVPSHTYEKGMVKGLRFETGKPLLDLGDAQVPVDDVVQIF
jgi:flagellar basal-body rod modification protein FlgD